MAKYASLDEYKDTFTPKALQWYTKCASLIQELNMDVEERLFAGQVAFYITQNLKRTFHESPVIMMAFYQDHVNVFASGNEVYQTDLPEYRFTDKGTMQIRYDAPFNKEILKELFIRSLQ